MANNKMAKDKKAAGLNRLKTSKVVKKKEGKTLAKQALIRLPPGSKGAGNGGIVPPPEVRWKKGQSGNPKGRPKTGASVKQWLDVMGSWPLEKVRSAARATHIRTAKRIAARLLAHAASNKLSKNGTPIAGPEFDRVMDRTVGRPKQEVELTGKDGKALAIEHGGPKPEWDKLSTEELTLVEGILVKTIESEKQRNQLPAPAENGNGKVEE